MNLFAAFMFTAVTATTATAQTTQPASSCDSNNSPARFTELTHTYPSGAVWSACATLDPVVGLRLHDLHYQAPGASLRKTFSELHLAGILEHYHDEPEERSVFETLRFGDDDFVSFTTATCPGALVALIAPGERHICTIEYADKLLAKFNNESVTQNHSWDIIATASNGLDTWEVTYTFGEEGSITASINRSGVLHQFTDNSLFGSNLIDLPNTTASNLAVNSTIKATWRIVPGMGGDTQTIEQLDFRLAPEFGNRRPMSIDTLNIETLRQVNREQFRRWQVKGGDGAGYLIDVQNNGFDYRSTRFNWALFDVGFTRYNECELTTLDNLERDETSNPDGCADSLEGYVNGESLEDSTPVIWFSQTTTISPDSDDYPLLRTQTLSFDLVPFDWTQTSPFAPSINAIESGIPSSTRDGS